MTSRYLTEFDVKTVYSTMKDSNVASACSMGNTHSVDLPGAVIKVMEELKLDSKFGCDRIEIKESKYQAHGGYHGPWC